MQCQRLAKECEGKSSLENPRHRRIILKLILKNWLNERLLTAINCLRAGQWSAFVNTAMNFWVQHQAKFFLSRWATLSLSGRLRNTTAYLILISVFVRLLKKPLKKNQVCNAYHLHAPIV